MTKDVKKFASDHAAALAEPIGRLCGKVIAKGMQGILEECCVQQQRIAELEQKNAQLLGALRRALVGLAGIRTEAEYEIVSAAIQAAEVKP